MAKHNIVLANNMRGRGGHKIDYNYLGPEGIQEVRSNFVSPIFYVEKVRERLEDGSVRELDEPILQKESIVFKILKKHQRVNRVHNILRNRHKKILKRLNRKKKERSVNSR